MNGIETITTFDTVYNADTVEWCPVPCYLNFLVCGTYQLNEETKDRFGRLYLLRVADNLHVVQQLEMAAIPDCKWCPVCVDSKILLAVATTAGQVIVYELKTDDCSESVQLLLLCEINLKRKNDQCELLILSLSWYAKDSDILISVSDSSGCVSVLHLTNNALSIKHNWKAHSYEAWTTAFNAFNPSTVYSGGDDSILNLYDTKSGMNVARITSGHNSGVTSILSNPKKENLFFSGSYDENIRFWDSRCIKKPVEVVNVGGGVWRLKLQPSTNKLLLAACMNGGAKIVNTERSSGDKDVIAEYFGHNSIVYGADWCHDLLEDISEQYPDLIHKYCSNLIATCSFYDHQLCLSGFHI